MKLLCYTRTPKEDILYANRLAYSVHLAYKEEKGNYVAFHHNEGLIYAKATHAEDGTLCAKSLKKPWLLSGKDEWFLLAAIRTEAEGERDQQNEGCILLWTSEDLVHYHEVGLYRLQEKGEIQEVRMTYHPEKQTYEVNWLNEENQWLEGEIPVEVIDHETKINKSLEETKEVYAIAGRKVEIPHIFKEDLLENEVAQIEGIQCGNCIDIDEVKGQYLVHKLLLPKAEAFKLSQNECHQLSELSHIKSIATYSDGSCVERKVDWVIPEEIGDKKEVAIEGRIHQEHFDFPFTENRADPCCMYWKGKYYFIGTNDADHEHTMYIRCSDTLQGVTTAEDVLILDSVTYPGIGGLLWAPEFHEIGGRMYIFHAATEGEFFYEASRVRVLKENGDPMCASDWSEPYLVVKKDGTPLCESGKVISLDMTTFYYQNKVYAIWSQRQFLPVDQGAWIYIATLDEKAPWKLTSDPVCIAKPEYGWENNHTFVVEGPYALEYNGQLMITYSGAAVDATYTVGLLKPVMGSDLLVPNNWIKSNYPLMSSRSCEGEYGVGHNSYVEDENGLVWNFYHGRKGVDGPRSSGARRVHFDIDGEPMLDFVEEKDLPEAVRKVQVIYKPQ